MPVEVKVIGVTLGVAEAFDEVIDSLFVFYEFSSHNELIPNADRLVVDYINGTLEAFIYENLILETNLLSILKAT